MGVDRREAGWTLAELIVVLGIVVALLTMVLPSLLGVRHTSYDVQVKLELTSAARAAAALEVEMGRYPDDPTWLRAAMPELDFSGTHASSIHLITGPVGSSPHAQVLLYARSVAGDWFGIRLVREGPDAGRHTCRGDAADMTLVTCTGVAW